MAVPVKFRKTTEQQLANFNFTDIANNTGIVQYYGSRTASSSLLLANPIYSDPIETTSSSIASNAFTLANTLNFDLYFNAPRTVRGLGVISFPLGATNDSGQNLKTYRTWASYALIRVGDTNTVIHSASSAIFSVVLSDGQASGAIKTVDSNINSTQIKRGEILRLQVEQWGKEDGFFSGKFTIAHDPMNRAGTVVHNVDTNLISQIPFRIDL